MKSLQSYTPLLATGLLVLSGCADKPEVVLVRPSHQPPGQGKKSKVVYDPMGRPMRVVYSKPPASAETSLRTTSRISPLPGAGPGRSTSRYQPVTHSRSAPSGLRTQPAELLEEVRVKRDYISNRLRSRTGKRMDARYITIHSTQNWSKGADAYRHALALKRGKLGKLCWHYTVDENVAIQHLPTTEQGQHADFDGPGNHYSIGIEMCEHPGNSRRLTVDRAAKLAAWLMLKHDIPLAKVVPHYHWPRWGHSPPHKNCPHFLLDNGKPGRKWREFLAQVKKHYDSITLPRSDAWVSR